MRFELPPLPYPKHALEPHISAEIMRLLTEEKGALKVYVRVSEL